MSKKISVTVYGEFSNIKENDKDVFVVIESFDELIKYIMSKDGKIKLKPISINHPEHSILFGVEE